MMPSICSSLTPQREYGLLVCIQPPFWPSQPPKYFLFKSTRYLHVCFEHISCTRLKESNEYSYAHFFFIQIALSSYLSRSTEVYIDPFAHNLNVTVDFKSPISGSL